VACKKYDRIYKKDYEPYQALGPQCGIFDQRAAEELNHFVDAMGADAIQMGGIVSWIMECVQAGLIDPAEFGFPPAAELRFDFANDTAHFDLVLDSRRNADYAYQVVYALLFDARCAIFRQGMRAAAKVLDDRPLTIDDPGVRERPSSTVYCPSSFVHRPSSAAVYLAHGERGCMVPNQYWVPGMLAPMPMMGKYFVYYGLDFLPPRELGKKCVERMVYELYNENSGICRFHRKWAEVIVDEIISSHYRFPVDFKTHQFELAQQIYALDGGAVVPWESERTVEAVWKYLEDIGGAKPNDMLAAWIKRFRADKWAAGRAYWDEIRAGIAEAFAAGPDAIPDQRAPGPAAAVDVMAKK
jgi:glyceraldehyde-3-phosphate dehydrogenase (ferredoxin)